MALQSSSPIVKDGIEYPYYIMNLAISPNIDGVNIGGSVALLLIPYRITPDNTLEFLDEGKKSFSYVDVFSHVAGGDNVLGSSVMAILSGVQQFINGKGI